MPGIRLDPGDLIMNKKRQCLARRWVHSPHWCQIKGLKLGNRKVARAQGLSRAARTQANYRLPLKVYGNSGIVKPLPEVGFLIQGWRR